MFDLRTIAEVEGAGVKAGKHAEWREQIIVPPLPQSALAGCSLIEIDYFIQVRRVRLYYDPPKLYFIVFHFEVERLVWAFLNNSCQSINFSFFPFSFSLNSLELQMLFGCFCCFFKIYLRTINYNLSSLFLELKSDSLIDRQINLSRINSENYNCLFCYFYNYVESVSIKLKESTF